MSVIVIADVAGGTQEFDEAVIRETGQSDGPPTGGLFRASGPIPGGWRVMSGWESMEVFENFRRDYLLPTYAKLGMQPTRLEIWPAPRYLGMQV
jgi:hypothetical protein